MAPRLFFTPPREKRANCELWYAQLMHCGVVVTGRGQDSGLRLCTAILSRGKRARGFSATGAHTYTQLSYTNNITVCILCCVQLPRVFSISSIRLFVCILNTASLRHRSATAPLQMCQTAGAQHGYSNRYPPCLQTQGTLRRVSHRIALPL